MDSDNFLSKTEVTPKCCGTGKFWIGNWQRPTSNYFFLNRERVLK